LEGFVIPTARLSLGSLRGFSFAPFQARLTGCYTQPAIQITLRNSAEASIENIDEINLVVNSGRRERSEIPPRRVDSRGEASAVRRERRDRPSGGSRCQNLRRSDQLRHLLGLFLLQSTRNGLLTSQKVGRPIPARSKLASSRCSSHLQVPRLPR
jgi:hypothetical protein